MRIEIEQPEQEELEEAGVFSWPVWEHEEDKLEWYYDKTEQCYIVEGSATIISEFDSLTIKPGDFLTLPAGLECVWDIQNKIKKHYSVE
ncbi:MAG TPA: cupin domain-containing protein [Mariniphaga sp.]|nr:cupin domain-containing protein [Mariniphaga sp.]